MYILLHTFPPGLETHVCSPIFFPIRHIIWLDYSVNFVNYPNVTCLDYPTGVDILGTGHNSSYMHGLSLILFAWNIQTITIQDVF